MPPDPFPPDEFDDWAASYDADVASHDTFPFAGYRQVLDTVVKRCDPQPGMSVLDLGTGTGNLALRFARGGCELWCTDFSAAMLTEAGRKLGGAHLVQHDLRQPLPPELKRRFDRIVSAYVFHHFELPERVQLCRRLVEDHLAPGGRLVIADLSFWDKREMEAFARSIGDLWEQEPYWLAEDALAALARAGLAADYVQVSPCAGVYALTPRPKDPSRNGGPAFTV